MKRALVFALLIAGWLTSGAHAATPDMTRPIVYRPLATDITLRQMMERWADLAGLRMDWRPKELNYPLTAKALALPPETNFVAAMKELSRIYSKVAVPINASIDKGVLVITRSDEINVGIGGTTTQPVPLPVVQQVAPAPAAATAPTSVAPDDKAIAKWEIKIGDSLKATLDAWRKRAGWDFLWNLPDDDDYISQANATFETDFQTAVTDLFSALPASLNVQVEMSGNKLLYVYPWKK